MIKMINAQNINELNKDPLNWFKNNIEILKSGRAVLCPQCNKGRVYNPYENKEYTHYFKCDNEECNFVINID